MSEAVRGAEGHLADTFVSVRGWGKGLIWINGFNLGWYWPIIGPQEAHYIPGPLLRDGENEIIMLEVEATPSDATGASPDFFSVPCLSHPDELMAFLSQSAPQGIEDLSIAQHAEDAVSRAVASAVLMLW